MVRFENDCCDCAVPAYPCRGADCPNRHVAHVYCDNCGGEVVDDDLWDDGNGMYICTDCLERKLQDLGIDTEYEDFYYADYADAISVDRMIEEAE